MLCSLLLSGKQWVTLWALHLPELLIRSVLYAFAESLDWMTFFFFSNICGNIRHWEDIPQNLGSPKLTQPLFHSFITNHSISSTDSSDNQEPLLNSGPKDVQLHPASSEYWQSLPQGSIAELKVWSCRLVFFFAFILSFIHLILSLIIWFCSYRCHCLKPYLRCSLWTRSSWLPIQDALKASLLFLLD